MKASFHRSTHSLIHQLARQSHAVHRHAYASVAAAQRRWQHSRTNSQPAPRRMTLTTTAATAATTTYQGSNPLSDAQHKGIPSASVLGRLPTSSVVRSLVLGACMVSPVLFKPSLALLQKVAKAPPTSMLNPDRNPLLRAVIKPLVYDQFCAGTDEREIRQCVASIRSMGFSGVILAYGKEILIYDRSGGADAATTSAVAAPAQGQVDQEIEQWRKGNLETISMMDSQDILAIKLSGAGISVTNALMSGGPLPAQLFEAMDDMAAHARELDCRIIIDAEQQALQQSIDQVAVGLMRKHNKDKVLIVNTLQAYLKEAKHKLAHQVALAQDQGWILAIKLVRGAYINNEMRDRIHATKADTDQCYNDIVASILTGTAAATGAHAANKSPRVELLIAGHNSESVDRALHMVQQLSRRKQLKTTPEFGQLQGMADNLSGTILQHNDRLGPAGGQAQERSWPAVKVYKYMTWGTVQECMEYLVRRAVENRGAADRLRADMRMMAGELKTRVVASLTGRH